MDCLFSWDASWEAVTPGAAGSAGPGTIEVDQTVLEGAKAHGKDYMMGNADPLSFELTFIER